MKEKKLTEAKEAKKTKKATTVKKPVKEKAAKVETAKVNTTGMSLKDQIKCAQTAQEIRDLLAAGKEYKYASDTTRRKWQKVADARLKELNR